MSTLSSKLILSLVDRVTAPARGVTAAMNRLTAAQRRNAAQLNRMRGQLIGAAGAGYALARGVSAPIRSAMEFESAMADVRKVVDFKSPAHFKQMGKDILDMSTKLPMAASGIAEIVAAAGQAGMQGGEVLQFAEMAAKVGVAFDMSAGQTGEALAKIKTALQLSVSETSNLADALNHLSNTSASSAPDLIDYMKRVGAAGLQYGFTAEQTAALGSAMIASGAEANVAATSFRNVGKALARGDSATKRQRKAYKALGIDAKKVAKQMQKDATGTLRAVMQRIGELPEHLRASTISDLFGDEARAIAPLVNNLELYDNALRSVAQQANYLGSSQKEYEARAATTANNMQLFKNKVEALSVAIGEALLPAVNSIMDSIGPYLTTITDLAREHPKVTAAIAATAAGLVALRIAAILAQFSFHWMKGGLIGTAILGLRGIGTAGKIGAAGLKSLRRAMIGASMLRAVGGGGGLVAAFAGMAAPIATLKAGAIALGSALAAVSWPIWVVIAGIAALGVAVHRYWEPISNFASGFLSELGSTIRQGVSEIASAGRKIASAAGSWAIEKAVDIGRLLGIDESTVRSTVDKAVGLITRFSRAALERVKQIGSSVGNWVAEIFSVKDYSNAAEKEFREAGRAAARAMIDAIASIPGKIVSMFRGLGSKIAAAIGKIRLSSILPQSLSKYFSGAPASPIEGAKAAGGNIVAGKTYLVGEYGPELVTPSKSGYVHDAGATASALGSSSGSPIYVSMTNNFNLEGQQSPREVAAHITEELNEALSGVQADIEWSLT